MHAPRTGLQMLFVLCMAHHLCHSALSPAPLSLTVLVSPHEWPVDPEVGCCLIRSAPLGEGPGQQQVTPHLPGCGLGEGAVRL